MPLLRAARAALGLIFRAGYRYQRAGVVLLDLSPAGALTGELFAPAGAARRERLLEVLDGINGRWGRGTLRYLAEGGAGGRRGGCAGNGCRRGIRRIGGG